MIRPVLLILAVLVAAAGGAHAQPAPRFDPAQCERGAAPRPAGAPDAVPPTWSGFELTGTFVDSRATVRAIIAPLMERNRALTDDARAELTASLRAIGYHLVGFGTREVGGATHAIVHVAPMPMVRRINVGVQQRLFAQLFDDEIRRRMGARVGAYLPWDPVERACKLWEETANIERFLRDEGYFDARATIAQQRDGAALILNVEVALGPEFTVDVDRIEIADARSLRVGADEIRAKFRHRGRCLIGPVACWFGRPRFTRAQHQLDIQAVVELFHARGYPAVRVRSDFDPGVSVDRRTKKVRFKLTIDQRRGLDVQFEGYNPGSVSVEQLKRQLTFDQASSTDDVEAVSSARALTAYLQSRGYFDARVTWNRERFAMFDRLIYRIDQGSTRVVRTVGFAGNRALSATELADEISTKPARLSTSLFGANAAVTSAMLDADADTIAQLYKRRGYRDVRVRVTASTEAEALSSAALTAGLLAAARGSGLHVRFTVDEGPATELRELRVELRDGSDAIATPEERALCTQILADLAELHAYPAFAAPITTDRCAARATGPLLLRSDVVAESRDRLRERLFAHGRPRAAVELAEEPVGPHAVAVRYRLANTQELHVGRLVLRGNFRTKAWIIRRELRLREGALLSSDALADGVRRLRNTGLFDAVNVTMLDLERASAGSVHGVVEVTERYGFAQVDLETGVSSFNGAFVKVIPSFKNLFGWGLSLDLTGTLGFSPSALYDDGELELRQLAAEATLRVPQWLLGRLRSQLELTAFHRRQETPRFGLLRTTGLTLSLSRTWERQRVGSRHARAITTGLHYDFRSRERNVDAIRSVGGNDDESQVPITTRTGSVGWTFEWEQRVDRRGALSPLAPEAGFRFDAQISYASPYLLGQDTFVKVSAAGSKYWSIGAVVLRADLRLDEGFPLAGAALLPEVERFFAGGEATVRGYEDERLATELIEVGVPPLGNVKQIRILPAGGNIRALASLDAQVRIYKILASALFVDAGMIANQWTTVAAEDIRPAAGIAVVRVVTQFGVIALERAVPLRPRLGDDPRGRWHFSFVARAQF